MASLADMRKRIAAQDDIIVCRLVEAFRDGVAAMELRAENKNKNESSDGNGDERRNIVGSEGREAFTLWQEDFISCLKIFNKLGLELEALPLGAHWFRFDLDDEKQWQGAESPDRKEKEELQEDSNNNVDHYKIAGDVCLKGYLRELAKVQFVSHEYWQTTKRQHNGKFEFLPLMIALQLISQRVSMGVEVAAMKVKESWIDNYTDDDESAIMERLTDTRQEQAVMDRIKNKLQLVWQLVFDENTGSFTCFTDVENWFLQLYTSFIIPSTKRVQVQFIRKLRREKL